MSETVVATLFLLGLCAPPLAVLASATFLLLSRSRQENSARSQAASPHHTGVAA